MNEELFFRAVLRCKYIPLFGDFLQADRCFPTIVTIARTIKHKIEMRERTKREKSCERARGKERKRESIKQTKKKRRPWKMAISSRIQIHISQSISKHLAPVSK